ncbi:hypothetical protein I7I48_01414 [Histoplasma ohiense]|nr:hypothetical protein I7I48_01414 [Histoplasma ohiense (nom. inval.)]
MLVTPTFALEVGVPTSRLRELGIRSQDSSIAFPICHMSADSGTTGETQKLQQCSLLAAQYGMLSTTLSKKEG